MTQRQYPQIKICGLTDPEQAVACAELGADAIGLVFYPKSPRDVTVEQAAAITARLPGHVAAVGVFVNPDRETLLQTMEKGGLNAAQLHGSESPEWINDLPSSIRCRVIKALFAERDPELNDAGLYDVKAYLVECGKGRLPGGNAMAWDWAIAEDFAQHYPMILAGGLGPDNVAEAISTCLPDGVDASSGLESGPGRKDMDKVKRFIEQVRSTAPLYNSRKSETAQVLSFPHVPGGQHAQPDHH